MYFVKFRIVVFLFFFFKQKTAYEMRISDWSSDVCSSDLDTNGDGQLSRAEHDAGVAAAWTAKDAGGNGQLSTAEAGMKAGTHWTAADTDRSEEHTSELQSLMRISYAVFCLKKKTANTHERQAYTRTLHHQH